MTDIIAYKKKHFSPDKINLVITGKISEDDIKNINSYFEDIKPGRPSEINSLEIPPNFKSRNPDIKLIRNSWDFVDIRISFDVDLNDTKPHELIFLTSVLGGGDGSRLQKSIREESGLAYSIFAETEMYNTFAAIHINMSVHKNNIYEAIEKVCCQLKQLSNISQIDIDTNITFFTDNLWFWLEDPEVLNQEICYNLIQSPDTSFSIENKIEKYKEITIPRLVEISDEIFQKSNMTIVILGNTKSITSKMIMRKITI